MKKPVSLSEHFRPYKYEISLMPSTESKHTAQLKIEGDKVGVPSHRITLHQKNIKINNAQLIKVDKKGNHIVFPIDRINYLKKKQELRLHSKEIIYPGKYILRLEYKSSIPIMLGSLNRANIPSIDEPEAWTNATVEFK